jgi:DoxX-like family
MQSTTEAMWLALSVMGSSTGRIWTGWTACGLTAAFMLFDAGGKFAKPKPVIDAFVRTGWPIHLASMVGTILLFSTALYLVPATLVLGAILLTGYLGGAVATNLRLENPLLTHTLFPVYVGVLSWVGLWLREPRIEAVFPLIR